MIRTFLPPGRGLAAFWLAATGAALAGPGARADEILNVSYDPTREFYRDYNALFAERYEARSDGALRIEQSHGGSGAQARAVIDGLGAQVVTLALAPDIDAIAAATGKIAQDWQARLPHGSAPYTSTIVFLVREGNPEGIRDWPDLIRDGVEVITPNPKTSGGARWNVMAAWAWAMRQPGATQETGEAYLKDLFAHVPVLDTGARGATTTFAQRGVGDVLIAWENEAFLSLAELGEDKFDIVVPSVSIRAEPPVALVEGNLADDRQRAAATAYLEQLYSPEAQAIAFRHYYRAWDSSLADPADLARFPEVEMATIAEFGGWDEVQPAFFGRGGVIDRVQGE
nr:sulfate ABC transporter substrate-binding protein [Mangrovicoccus ximenensis]